MVKRGLCFAITYTNQGPYEIEEEGKYVCKLCSLGMDKAKNSLVSYWQENEQLTKYFLAAILESLQDSVVSIDLNRVITTWNRGAELLYGYTAEEAIGKPLTLVMLPKDVQDLIDKVDAIKHEVAVPLYESVRVHKSGKTADLQIGLSPVRNSEGHVIGVSTVARDVTEAKLQEQLKDEFIAVASHELKTPITSIRSYAELLEEHLKNSTDTTAFSMVQKLNTQVERMIELVKTLLDTTRLRGGEVPMNPESLELKALISDITESVQQISEKHQIQIEADSELIVVGDKRLLSQAITNLLANAVKYSPAGGKVIVSAKKKNQHAEISVQDFGVGIPDDLTNKIFERYFRVQGTTRSKTSGIGLGLYITAQIVRQHGSEISVISEEGVGSTFSFLLPLDNWDKIKAA